jgi:hypothetical protein
MQFILDPNLPTHAKLPGWDAKKQRRYSNDEAIQHEIDRSAFDQPVVSWRRIKQTSIPTDRTYRNAWVDAGTSIEHHMPTARELHRQILREQRAPILQKLDVEYMKAIEAGDKKRQAAIAQHKQVLRDAPQNTHIEEVETIDELKEIVLPELTI